MEAIQYLRTFFVAVLALSLSGCAKQSATADHAQPDPIAVRVATPKHVRIPAEVVVSGTVETPSAPASIGFLVSGKVIRVGPREGDFVKAGEVLAVIDPADFQFAVEAAIAQSALARAQNEKAFVSARPEQVEQARANLSQAEDEFRRMKTLYEKKSLAPNDFKKYDTASSALAMIDPAMLGKTDPLCRRRVAASGWRWGDQRWISVVESRR